MKQIGWTNQVHFDSMEIHLDQVVSSDGVVYYLCDDGTLGDSLGFGAKFFPTKNDAIDDARRQIDRFHQKMLNKLPLGSI